MTPKSSSEEIPSDNSEPRENLDQSKPFDCIAMQIEINDPVTRAMKWWGQAILA
jgi:hypothetical protein